MQVYPWVHQPRFLDGGSGNTRVSSPPPNSHHNHRTAVSSNLNGSLQFTIKTCAALTAILALIFAIYSCFLRISPSKLQTPALRRLASSDEDEECRSIQAILTSAGRPGSAQGQQLPQSLVGVPGPSGGAARKRRHPNNNPGGEDGEGWQTKKPSV